MMLHANIILEKKMTTGGFSDIDVKRFEIGGGGGLKLSNGDRTFYVPD